jgi:hypothetical protein
MAIPLTGSTGLFTRLGRLAGLLKWNARQQARLNARRHDTLSSFSSRMDLVGTIPTTIETATASQAAYTQQIVAAAQRTLLDMVKADAPERATSVPIAVAEVIRQMIAANKFVSRCGLTSSIAASPVLPNPSLANVGNGTVVMTLRQPNGLLSENLFGENARLSCVTDGNSGGTAGQETFRFVGSNAASGLWNHDWPAGSGVTADVPTCDPTSTVVSNSAGQSIVTNGGWDSWNDASTLPTGWTLYRATGAPSVAKELPRTRRGTAAVRFSDLSTELRQTGERILPLTAYAVSFALRRPTWAVDRVATASVCVEAIDAFGSVVVSTTGEPLRLSVTAAAADKETTYQWVLGSAAWHTPRTPIAFVRVKVESVWDASQPSGYAPESPIVDDLLITPMVYPYAGGPGLAVVAGEADWLTGDGFELTLVNDRANAPHGFTWQAVFDRFFSTRANGLLLPSGDPASGSCIADSLIDTSPTFDDAPSPPPPPATYPPVVIAPSQVQATSSKAVVSFQVVVNDPDTPIGSVTLAGVADPSGEVSGITITGSSNVRTVAVTLTGLNSTEFVEIDLTATDASSLTGTATTKIVGPIPSPPPPPPNSPPTITAIADQSAVSGTTIGPIAFVVGDDYTPAASLTVFASSANQAVVPNSGLTLGGTGSIRTVTVDPLNGTVTGTSNITVTVVDGGGLTAADTFQVEYTASPPPPPPPVTPSVTARLMIYDFQSNTYVPYSTHDGGSAYFSNVAQNLNTFLSIASGQSERTTTMAQATGDVMTVSAGPTNLTGLTYMGWVVTPSGETGTTSQALWESDALARVVEFRYQPISGGQSGPMTGGGGSV